MTIGEVLIILVSFFLVASVLVVEWERYKRKNSGLNLNIKRHIFRRGNNNKKRK